MNNDYPYNPRLALLGQLAEIRLGCLISIEVEYNPHHPDAVSVQNSLVEMRAEVVALLETIDQALETCVDVISLENSAR